MNATMEMLDAARVLELREGKAYMDVNDIMRRYAVGINKARSIMRSIRSVCGGGRLGCGKVLPSEVAYWESTVDERQVRL